MKDLDHVIEAACRATFIRAREEGLTDPLGPTTWDELSDGAKTGYRQAMLVPVHAVLAEVTAYLEVEATAFNSPEEHEYRAGIRAAAHMIRRLA